jgi:alpha-beta hydrolase superfamily lysophospholipase
VQHLPEDLWLQKQLNLKVCWMNKKPAAFSGRNCRGDPVPQSKNGGSPSDPALRKSREATTFIFRAADAHAIFVHRWFPETPPKAVLQIAHGIAEHSGRYGRLAAALTRAGYAVYANDHRGHGRTACNAEELGVFAKRDGWRKCLGDLWGLNRHIACNHPGLPIVLLGHSMGSFMTQQFICEHGEALAGAVLAGSSGKPSPLIAAVQAIARIERLRLGPQGKSTLVQALSFGTFNRPFQPARTRFDWLSRDQIEVDKYVADPFCGFQPSVQLSLDVLEALSEICRPRKQARIPKQLPIYIIAGTCDPVGSNTRTLDQLLAAYRLAGLQQVTHRYYPGARHELFNEINREEVTSDLLAWLAEVVVPKHCRSPDRTLKPKGPNEEGPGITYCGSFL